MSLTVIPTDSTATCGDCAKPVGMSSANSAAIANLMCHGALIQSCRCLGRFLARLLAFEQFVKPTIKNAALIVVMMIFRAINWAFAAEIERCGKLHGQHRRNEINPESGPEMTDKSRTERASGVHAHARKRPFEGYVRRNKASCENPRKTCQVRRVAHIEDNCHQDECDYELGDEGYRHAVWTRQRGNIVHGSMRQRHTCNQRHDQHAADSSNELRDYIKKSVPVFYFAEAPKRECHCRIEMGAGALAQRREDQRNGCAAHRHSRQHATDKSIWNQIENR